MGRRHPPGLPERKGSRRLEFLSEFYLECDILSSIITVIIIFKI